jgi:hypothetical protein
MTLQPWITWTALGALSLLAACSAGGGTNAVLPGTAGNAPDAQRSQSKTVFVIKVPKNKKHRRGSRYISGHTQSISIQIRKSPSGTAVLTLTQNLTTASPGCVSSGGVLTCTVAAKLAPGSYTALVDAFDGLNQAPPILSEGQSVPAIAKPGVVNTIPLTLGGIPHTLEISSGAVPIHKVHTNQFKLYGSVAQPIVITARDADGSTIVGPDSLQYTSSVVSGSGWAVQATPNPSTPNTFAVTPPGIDGSAATLKIAFDYSAVACAESGAICSATYSVTNDIQYLAVVDCGISCSNGTAPDAILVYKLPNVTTPFARVTKGVLDPITVAMSASGTLVANCKSSCIGTVDPDSVTVYPPPYTTTAPTTITSGVNYPTLMAVNPAGDLFANDCLTCNFGGPDYVTEYSHTALTTVAGTLPANGQINAVSTDPAGDVVIADCVSTCGWGAANPDEALVFASPYTSSAAITNGVSAPTAFAFDPLGNMYVANCITCSTTTAYSVTKYTLPYSASSTPTLTITGGDPMTGAPPYVNSPQSLATDSAFDLFVGNGPGGPTYQNIAEFLYPSFSGNGTLLLPGYQPYEMRIDGYDDIIESSGDTVERSAPPYTTQVHVIELGPSTNQPFAISP